MNMAAFFKYTFSSLTLALTLSSHCSIAMEDEKIHGIILKAQLPSKQEITFVPTHHFTSLEKFSQPYQQEIFKHSALILESFVLQEVSTEEDRLKTSPLGRIAKYASKDFINQIGGMQDPADPAWSFNNLKNCDDPSMIQLKVESTFTELATLLESATGLHFPHLYNIYEMKPGVVFALYWEINSFQQGNGDKGMDSEITDYFLNTSKMVTGVESKEDVIKSLPLSTATIDDIQDDFISPDIGEYLPNLEAMHNSFMKHFQEKRLMNQESLAIRNKSWIAQYESMINKHGDCVAVHGQDHFLGEAGIIQLGQLKGWEWSIFQKDGLYQPFKYFPRSQEKPFVFEGEQYSIE